jgi:hypothetical protein
MSSPTLHNFFQGKKDKSLLPVNENEAMHNNIALAIHIGYLFDQDSEEVGFVHYLPSAPQHHSLQCYNHHQPVAITPMMVGVVLQLNNVNNSSTRLG